MKLNGSYALITGGAKRIGKQIAQTLADSGCNIILHYHESKSEAETLAKDLSRKVKVETAQLSFSCWDGESIESRVERFTREIFQRVSKIDILVNNAAIFYPAPLQKATEANWDDFMTVNLKFPFFLAQAFGLKMKKNKQGKIINLTDWTAFRPNENYIPYAISKAGMVSMTQGLAKALAPYVQVNAIAPGAILPAAGSTKQQNENKAKASLAKRFGGSKDIANTVKYLCEATDFVTGAVIPVEGGASLV